VEALKPLFEKYPDSICDGELYNHYLRDDFNAIVSMVRKTKLTQEDLDLSRRLVEYHVYDLPSEADLPFSKRFGALVEMMLKSKVSKASPEHDLPIKIVETKVAKSEQEVDDAYGSFLEKGYEGGIIRLDSGGYEQKRSSLLIKRKEFEDSEFEIIRIEEGLGNWSGAAKRVVFRNNDGREVGAGLKGSREYARTVLAEADQYIGKKVTVQFFTRTPDGVPRFPIAKILHKDERW
jgi:ATP-dependent DNA ligase